jgi:hypothetical protein
MTAKLTSPTSGGWKSKIKAPADLVSDEVSSWFVVSSMAEDRERKLTHSPCLLL